MPIATRYQSTLLDNVIKMETVLGKEEGDKLSGGNIDTVRKIASHVEAIRTLVEEMINRRRKANKIEDERGKAVAYHDTVAPMLDEIRDHIDRIELMVDDELWALPKYRELLFL